LLVLSRSGYSHEHLQAARERVREMGDPQQEESSQRAAARERAAREKVERLEQALEEMAKVQAAPQAHAEPSQRRVSETEPEARLMKQSDGGRAPSHNVQISTDTAHSIIVGASVTQAASDQHELVPAMEEVERQLGRQPQHLVVDAGYTTRENILAAAEKGDVLEMILRLGLTLILSGVVLGLAAAWASTRALESLLFQVHTRDAATFGSACLVLFALGLLACYIPARQATKVGPMVALRYE